MSPSQWAQKRENGVPHMAVRRTSSQYHVKTFPGDAQDYLKKCVRTGILQRRKGKKKPDDSCSMTIIVISLLSLGSFNPGNKSWWEKMHLFLRNTEIIFFIFSTNLDHLCPYQLLVYFDYIVNLFWHLIIKKSQ